MGESDSRDDLREHELQAVVPIVDQFEHDCIAGLAPSIEKIRDELEPRYRQYVVVNCVRIELEQAKTVTRRKCDDYLRRFPRYESDLLQAFEDFEDKITEAVEEPAGSDTEPMPSSPAEDTAAGFQSLLDGDNYTFISLLGGGNFGTVYLAHSKKLDQNVAIKVIRDSINTPSQPGVDLMQEVQVLLSLNHPSIVRLLDTEITRIGQIALVMEFIDGPNLSDYLEKHGKKRPQEQAVQIVTELARALVHVHEQGVFHLDLKPGNILIRHADGCPQPVIADFGLSVFRKQWSNRIGGTPKYAAPEQLGVLYNEHSEWSQKYRVGAKSDLYSVGIILYLLLTGDYPFDPEQLKSTASCHELLESRKTRPEPPKAIDSAIPTRLSDICLICLEFNPENRFSSATDLLEALDSLNSPAADANTEFELLRLRPLTSKDRGFYRRLLDATPGSSLHTQIDPLIQQILPAEDANVTSALPRVVALSAPSGAGKSSWFSAGVLPTLRERDRRDALTVVILNAEEDSADPDAGYENTVARLRQQLIYRLSLPRTTTASLEDILTQWKSTAAPRPERKNSAKKLLIVIDQFEQWLNVHGQKRTTQLQQALKLCDGHLVQALLIFRSDFIDRAEKFMRGCDSRRADGSSGFSIDPLTGDEAATILDHLLSTPGAASRWPQESDRQIALQHAGKLLSDAAKRHGGVCPAWVVMVARFLVKHASDPLQLQHQRSLSDVALSRISELLEGPAGSPLPLAALYPDIVRCLIDEEAGGDLRRPVSFDQFRRASLKGTTADSLRQALQRLESDDLIIHMQVNTAGRQEAVWQLTHEIWIQPLRQWLDHIPRSKAESLLANRTAAWIKSGESRHLLNTGELVQVFRIVPAERRSQDQTKFLRRSVVHVSQNWLLKFIVPGILLITVLAQALRLSELIGQSGTASISSEITGAPFYLRAYVRNRLTKELQNRRQSASSDPRLWLGVQIALLKLLEPTDPLFQQESQRLLEGLPTTPTEFRTEILQYLDVAAAEIRKVNGKFLDQEFRDAQSATTGNDLNTAASKLADYAWIRFLLNQPEQVNRTLGLLPDRSAIALFTTRLEEWLSVDGIDKRLLQQNAALDPGILMELLPAIGDSKRPSTALQEVVRINAQSNLAHIRRTAQRIAKRWMPDERFRPHPEWYLMPIGDQELCFLKVSIPHTTPAAQLYVLETEVPWAIVKSLLPEIHEREGKPDLDLPAGGLTASEMIKICNMLSEKFEFVKVYEPTGEAREWKRKDKANGFRLPTEVEFFYFALGSAHRQPANTSYRYMGDSITDDLYYSQLKKYANVQGSNVSSNGVNNSSRVGSLRANAVGLYDTLGNVSEVNWHSEKSTANEDFYTNGGDYENDIGLTTLKPDISGRGMPIFIDHDSGTDTVGFRIVRDAGP